MNNEIRSALSEIVEPGGNSIEAIERASVDIQIATAHQYPRSLTLFKSRALEMVSMDEETAQSCIYRRPVGKKNNKVEYAEGKSIRMAEIVGCCYGNLRVAAMIIEQTDRFVRCRGMAHDLESNLAASSEVIESTLTKEGMPYSERMRIVVAKACLSKARRDAIFQVVPVALCKTIEDVARQTAIGTVATLGKRRKTLEDWINKLGIEPERVYAALQVKGIDDVGLGELETLTGLRTAIKDNDITVDEAFPREPVAMPKKKTEPKKSLLEQQADADFQLSIQKLSKRIPAEEYGKLMAKYEVSEPAQIEPLSKRIEFKAALQTLVDEFNQ
jgi:hypothetical protein